MKSSVINGVSPAGEGTKPSAVFITGLPGAGKSTLAAKLSSSTFALVDVDSLRLHHGQYAAIEAEEAASCTSYLELIPWFDEGSRLEECVFRSPTGLMNSIFYLRLSFVQPAVVCRSGGNVSWLETVTSKGYRCHLMVVDASVETASSRALGRALRTGRACSA